MTSRQLVVFLAGLSLVLSFTAPNSGVANFTHLSGLAAGWLYFQAAKRLENSAKPRDAGDGTQISGRVDAILEKISRKGEASLTAAERDELDEYARTRGGRA